VDSMIPTDRQHQLERGAIRAADRTMSEDAIWQTDIRRQLEHCRSVIDETLVRLMSASQTWNSPWPEQQAAFIEDEDLFQIAPQGAD
jgi:hypothetical protein